MGCSCIKIVLIKVSNILRDSLLSSKRTTISFEFKARFDGWCLPFIYFHFLHVLLAHIPCMLGTIQESPVALSRWVFGGLSLPKQCFKPLQIEIWNTMIFYQIVRMSSPLHKCKDPYWRLSGDRSGNHKKMQKTWGATNHREMFWLLRKVNSDETYTETTHQQLLHLVTVIQER